MKPKLILACLAMSLGAGAQNVSPHWSLSGNNNATTASKLGTTNAIPLRLFTNNLERFRVDASGRIAAGTTITPGKFTLFNNGGVPSAAWKVTGVPLMVAYAENTPGNADILSFMASNTGSARPVYSGRRARGTLAAPLAVAKGDMLSSITAFGYDGTAFQSAASIDFLTDAAATAGNVPGKIYFYTGSNSSNRAVRLTLGSKGDVLFNKQDLFIQGGTGNIGINTTFPQQKLHVNGPSLFGGGVSIKSLRSGLEVIARDTVDEEYVTDYGIRTIGGGVGLIAHSEYKGGSGVHAEGSYTGLYARGGWLEGAGVIAEGIAGPGVMASSNNDNYPGGYFEGPRHTGVWAFGKFYGLEAAGEEVGLSARGETGIVATGNTYAGVFNGDVVTSANYQVSDQKMKTNIKDLDQALSIIGNLQPKVYEYKKDEQLKPLHLPEGQHYGLLAQDVEQVLPQVVKTATRRIDKGLKVQYLGRRTSDKGLTLAGITGNMKEGQENAVTMEVKAVNYTELVPVLVKAIQEQQQQIEALKSEVAALKGNNRSSLSNAFIGGVTPNPVQGTASIRYSVPEGKGTLLVTDAAGRQIRSMSLQGTGTLSLDVSALAAGVYNYSLIVGGQVVDTKRLTVTR